MSVQKLVDVVPGDPGPAVGGEAQAPAERADLPVDFRWGEAADAVRSGGGSVVGMRVLDEGRQIHQVALRQRQRIRKFQRAGDVCIGESRSADRSEERR